MISLSPSERFVALLKSESNNAKDSEKKQYLEVGDGANYYTHVH